MESSVIDDLAALQAIDRRNRDRELEIAEIEREATTQTSLLEEKRREAALVAEELAGLAARRRELEAKIQDDDQKMKDKRMRLGRLRNDKEAAALQHEIEATRESRGRTEEEALSVLEQAETLEGTKAAIDEQVEAVSGAVAKIEQSGRVRAEQLRREIAADRGERESLAGRLGDALRRRYEQIFQRRNGVAVIEVSDGRCRGCNMNLPPQLFIKIQRRVDIESCPNCQRMLFWRPGSGAQADEA